MNYIKTKSKYFKLYKQGFMSTESNDALQFFFNKVILSVKRSYFLNHLETNIGNIKKTWAVIRK